MKATFTSRFFILHEICRLAKMKYIQAKSILTKVRNAPDSWFGLTYNMNLYRGCQHQCIYCDSRSECYRIDDFAEIRVKQNAIEILKKELKSKKLKGTIGTGGMNDPYMPVEEYEMLTRRALEAINMYRFPVHVLTKSNLVLRDIDILQEIGKTYSAVSFTITTAIDSLAAITEPGASSSTERFEAMSQMAKNGIYTGMMLMPVLPFITDSSHNIRTLVKMAADSGAKYIVGAMGMTLRDKQREYYYARLDENFPGLKEKYIKSFGFKYGVGPSYAKELKQLFVDCCKEHGLKIRMDFYKPQSIDEQLSLF